MPIAEPPARCRLQAKASHGCNAAITVTDLMLANWRYRARNGRSPSSPKADVNNRSDVWRNGVGQWRCGVSTPLRANFTTSSSGISRPSRHASLNASSPNAARACAVPCMYSACSYGGMGEPSSSRNRSAAPQIRAARRGASMASARSAKPSMASAASTRSLISWQIVRASRRCHSAAFGFPCAHSTNPREPSMVASPNRSPMSRTVVRDSSSSERAAA